MRSFLRCVVRHCLTLLAGPQYHQEPQNWCTLHQIKVRGAICSLCRTAKASPEQHTRRSSRPGPDSRTLEGRHSFATFSIVAARVEGYIIAIDTHIRLLQGWVCQCTLGQGDVIHDTLLQDLSIACISCIILHDTPLCTLSMGFSLCSIRLLPWHSTSART